MISLPRGKTLRLAKKREKRVLGALNRGYKSFVHTVTYAQLLKLSSVLVESKLEIELEIASQLSVNAWKNFDSSSRVWEGAHSAYSPFKETSRSKTFC